MVRGPMLRDSPSDSAGKGAQIWPVAVDLLRVDAFTSIVALAVDPLYPGPGGRFRRRSFGCKV